jgi:hypothetical protein
VVLKFLNAERWTEMERLIGIFLHLLDASMLKKINITTPTSIILNVSAIL